MCSCVYLCVTAYVGYARQARYVFLCTGEKKASKLCLCVSLCVSGYKCETVPSRKLQKHVHVHRSSHPLAEVRKDAGPGGSLLPSIHEDVAILTSDDSVLPTASL